MKDEAQKVIVRIEEILQNQEGVPLDATGSHIVGATIVRDNYEQLCEQYPLFSIIAELGADLETLEDHSESKKNLEQIHTHLETLKASVHNTR